LFISHHPTFSRHFFFRFLPFFCHILASESILAFSSEMISGGGDGTHDRIPMSSRHSSDSSQVAEKVTVGSETPNHKSFGQTCSLEHGESTLFESEDGVQKAVDNPEGDWENDPENARNWSTGKKLTALCIVRRRLDLLFG
jgi:hypothetical protein